MADAHAERVKGIFSRIARKYDLFNALSSFGIYRDWLRRVARAASCDGGDRVLDVAGGTGDVAFALCELCPSASIELTDFTPEMLDVAAERIARGEGRGVQIACIPAPPGALPLQYNAYVRYPSRETGHERRVFRR